MMVKPQDLLLKNMPLICLVIATDMLAAGLSDKASMLVDSLGNVYNSLCKSVSCSIVSDFVASVNPKLYRLARDSAFLTFHSLRLMEMRGQSWNLYLAYIYFFYIM